VATGTGKHNGMHENRIDNHEINKDMNSTKFFIIYISSQKPKVKCKFKKKKAHKGCVQWKRNQRCSNPSEILQVSNWRLPVRHVTVNGKQNRECGPCSRWQAWSQLIKSRNEDLGSSTNALEVEYTLSTCPTMSPRLLLKLSATLCSC